MTSPFEGFRVYRLDRHRLNLPKEIAEFLGWYSPGEGCEALAMPSPHGGIIVLSPDARELRNTTLDQLEERPPLGPEDLGSEEFTRALRLRMSWTVTMGRDGRLTLPAEARDGGLVPSAPDATVAVAVVLGAIQIWGVEDLPVILQRLVASDAD